MNENLVTLLSSNTYWQVSEQEIESLQLLAHRLMSKDESIGTRLRRRHEARQEFVGNSIQSYAMDVTGQEVLKSGEVCFEGVLLKQGYCGRGMLSKSSDIRAYADDPSISCIVLRIDSGGGMVEGTASVGSAIEYAKKKKPVLAWIPEGRACSAAYKIASYAHLISVQYSSCEVGSIGTMVNISDYKGMAERQGAKFFVLYASQSHRKNEELRSLLDNNNASLLQARLDSSNEEFKSVVLHNRPQIAEQYHAEVFSGATFKALEALKMGMIDSIESEESRAIVSGYQRIKQEYFTKSNHFNQNSFKPMEESKESKPTGVVGKTGILLQIEADQYSQLVEKLGKLQTQQVEQHEKLLACQTTIATLTAENQKLSQALDTLTAKAQSDEKQVQELQAQLKQAQDEYLKVTASSTTTSSLKDETTVQYAL
jgi:protease-4